MLERRNDNYSFTAQKDLIAFFEPLIPRKIIKKIINEMQQNFTARKDSPESDTRLQFLKKVECELNRIVRERKSLEQ